MRILFNSALLLVGFILACSKDSNHETLSEYPESFTINLENKTNIERFDEIITLDVDQITSRYPTFNPGAVIILSDTSELAEQTNDLTKDGNIDEIAFICNLNPNEEKEITVCYAKSGQRPREYPKRTQAELSHKFGGKFITNQEGRPEYEGGEFENVQFLRVPPQHTDHSFFIRYEGPGWESDKVGYRFYLDWRNATDIFGKKVAKMVLQNVGQDGFDSYHEMSDWGMDVLKVGESLGIGSIGMWFENKAERISHTDSVTCEIVLNGSIQSLIRTKYFGWKIGAEIFQLTSDLSINAGSRLTRHDLTVSGNPDNLCTGIVKLLKTHILQPQQEAVDWTYFATYGRQSLVNDQLGMAIIFHKNDLIEITEDEFSHVVLLKPRDGKLVYYFLAAWEQELGGIKNEIAFIEYLEQVIVKLNSPIPVIY